MHKGTIYEPRSFWEVFSGAQYVTAGVNMTVESSNVNWYNGTKYPIEIREFALAPIGVQLSNIQDFNALGFATNKITYQIRGRRNISRAFNTFAGLAAFANTNEPPMRATVGETTSPSRYASPWGVCYKEYPKDRPLTIPGDAAIELALSNPLIANDGGTASCNFTVAYTEYGGGMQGAARTYRDVFSQATSAVSLPYPFWNSATINAGTNINWFQTVPFEPRMLFDAKEFRSQSPTRAGSVAMRGCNVMLDQNGFYSSMWAANSAYRVMPASMGVATKMGVVLGGSGEKFWRDGAPLPLVFTDITPALVWRLAEPFILAPDDQLKLEITVPPSISTAGLEGTQFGIAANGYAIIQG